MARRRWGAMRVSCHDSPSAGSSRPAQSPSASSGRSRPQLARRTVANQLLQTSLLEARWRREDAGRKAHTTRSPSEGACRDGRRGPVVGGADRAHPAGGVDAHEPGRLSGTSTRARPRSPAGSASREGLPRASIATAVASLVSLAWNTPLKTSQTLGSLSEREASELDRDMRVVRPRAQLALRMRAKSAVLEGAMEGTCGAGDLSPRSSSACGSEAV